MSVPEVRTSKPRSSANFTSSSYIISAISTPRADMLQRTVSARGGDEIKENQKQHVRACGGIIKINKAFQQGDVCSIAVIPTVHNVRKSYKGGTPN